MVHVFFTVLELEKSVWADFKGVCSVCVHIHIHTQRHSTHACIHGTMEDLFFVVLFAQLKTEGLPLLTLLN